MIKLKVLFFQTRTSLEISASVRMGEFLVMLVVEVLEVTIQLQRRRVVGGRRGRRTRKKIVMIDDKEMLVQVDKGGEPLGDGNVTKKGGRGRPKGSKNIKKLLPTIDQKQKMKGCIVDGEMHTLSGEIEGVLGKDFAGDNEGDGTNKKNDGRGSAPQSNGGIPIDSALSNELSDGVNQKGRRGRPKGSKNKTHSDEKGYRRPKGLKKNLQLVGSSEVQMPSEKYNVFKSLTS
ncbi:lysine-specific demethylase JMJ25-like [Forsythia ovata]|uniref:Lysine-specific demethylase JMJ25-like n=1 Tax=Forsythia ovata TaxID=205694 RepID=A0ABD1WFK3_9LAMI